jgi:hypothetical protein
MMAIVLFVWIVCLKFFASSVGAPVGEGVGAVGAVVGDAVGACVGFAVGRCVGRAVGGNVGAAVGARDVGASDVGAGLAGATVVVGACDVGALVGVEVGAVDASTPHPAYATSSHVATNPGRHILTHASALLTLREPQTLGPDVCLCTTLIAKG